MFFWRGKRFEEGSGVWRGLGGSGGGLVECGRVWWRLVGFGEIWWSVIGYCGVWWGVVGGSLPVWMARRLPDAEEEREAQHPLRPPREEPLLARHHLREQRWRQR